MDSAHDGAANVVDVFSEEGLGGKSEGDVDDDKGTCALERGGGYVIKIDRNGGA
jgi:hypothetical protein